FLVRSLVYICFNRWNCIFSKIFQNKERIRPWYSPDWFKFTNDFFRYLAKRIRLVIWSPGFFSNILAGRINRAWNIFIKIQKIMRQVEGYIFNRPHYFYM